MKTAPILMILLLLLLAANSVMLLRTHVGPSIEPKQITALETRYAALQSMGDVDAFTLEQRIELFGLISATHAQIMRALLEQSPLPQPLIASIESKIMQLPNTQLQKEWRAMITQAEALTDQKHDSPTPRAALAATLFAALSALVLYAVMVSKQQELQQSLAKQRIEQTRLDERLREHHNDLELIQSLQSDLTEALQRLKKAENRQEERLDATGA